jgi:MFS family permease
VHVLAFQIFVFAAGAVTSPVAITRVVNQRFVAMRGLAIGLTVAGSGAMAVIAPPILASVIGLVGWRGAYQVIALLIALSAAVSLILLWPAGGRIETPLVTKEEVVTDAKEGTDVVLFFRLFITFLLISLGIGGFAFHLVSLLTDAGVSLARAASIQSLIGLSILVARPGTGFLIDRFFAPRVAALILALAAAGLAGLASLGPAAAPICALLVGFALGAEVDLIGYLVARYFGLRYYGRLVGVLYGFASLGLGLSPVLMSRMQQTSGSYSGPLWASFAMLVLAAISMLALPRFGGRK